MHQPEAKRRRSDERSLSSYLPEVEDSHGDMMSSAAADADDSSSVLHGGDVHGPPSNRSSLSHVATGVSLRTTTLNLESELLELKRAAINQDATIRELRWTCEQAEGAARRYQQELHSLQAKDERQLEEINSLRTQVKQKEQHLHNETLRREEVESTLSLERDSATARISTLRNEVETLQEELNRQASDFARESATVVGDVAMAEKKFITLQFAHTQLKSAHDEALQQNETLLKQLTHLRSEAMERDKELQKQTAAYAEANTERLSLREQLSHLETELTALRKQTQPYARRSVLLSDALRTADESRTELNELRERCEFLEAQNEAFRQRCHRTSTNDEHMLTEVEEARTRIVSLERSLAAGHKAVETLEAQNKALQTELEQTRQEAMRFKRFKETLEDQATGLLRNAQGLQGKHPRDLLQELLELKEALRITEERSAAALESQSRELHDRLKEMEVTVAAHNSHKTAIIQELTQQQALLRTRCEEYMKRIGSLESDMALASAAERRSTTELHTVQEERNRLQQRLEAASAQMKEAHESAQEIQSEKLQLAMMIAMKDSQIRMLQGQYGKEAERAARVLREKEEAYAATRTTQAELAEVRLRVKESDGRREALELDLTQKKTELSQAESAKTFVEQEARALREELISEGKRYSEGRRLLDEQAVKLEGWLRQVQSENAELRETLRERDIELERRNEELQLRELDLHRASQAMNSLKIELNSAKTEIAELEKKLSGLQGETHEKERQINNLRKDFHSLYELSSVAVGVNSAGSNTPHETAATEPPSRRPSLAPVSQILSNDRTPPRSVTAGEKLVENLRHEVEERDRRIKQIEEAFRELESEVENIHKPQINRLREELETAEKKLEVAHGTTAELERQLQQEGKNSHSLRCRVDELEEQRMTLETNAAQLEHRLHEASQRLDDVVNSTKRAEEELESARNNYRAVIQAHAADMHQVESNAAERSRLLESVEEARRSIDVVHKERANERAEFERYMGKARTDHAALQKAYEDLQQEFNTLAPKLLLVETSGDPKAADTVLQIQCSQAIRQRDSLANEVEVLKLDAAQLRARNNALEGSADQLKAQLGDANKRAGELRRKIAAQASLYSPDILLERATLQKQVEEIEAQNATLLQRVSQLETELGDEKAQQLPLRTQLERNDAEVSLLRREVESYKKSDAAWSEQYSTVLASFKNVPPPTPPGRVKIPEQAVKDLILLIRRSVRYALLGSLMIRIRPGALEKGAPTMLLPTASTGAGDAAGPTRKRVRAEELVEPNPTPKQLVKRVPAVDGEPSAAAAFPVIEHHDQMGDHITPEGDGLATASTKG